MAYAWWCAGGVLAVVVVAVVVLVMMVLCCAYFCGGVFGLATGSATRIVCVCSVS